MTNSDQLPPGYFLATGAQRLLDTRGALIAPIYCQQQIGAGDLLPELSCAQGLCRACRKQTLIIDCLSYNQLRAALNENPRLCFASTENLRMWQGRYDVPALLTPFPETLPKIRCVRSVSAANRTTKQGFYPVMVCVAGAVKRELSFGILVRQHQGGTVQVHTLLDGKRLTTMDWMACETFEGCQFDTSNPFYAYLVPRNLPMGTRVSIKPLAHPVIKRIVNDCIEPLKSCEAIWNGVGLDFILPRIERSYMIG